KAQPPAAKAETEPAPAPAKKSPSARKPTAPPVAEGSLEPTAVPAEPEAPATPAAGGPAVDVDMLRRSWSSVIERVGPVLRAQLEMATPVVYDGTTLELAFPPNRSFAVVKV